MSRYTAEELSIVVEVLFKRALNLAKQIDKYEQALKFYADPENWLYKPTSPQVSQTDSDLGDIARKALEDKK